MPAIDINRDYPFPIPTYSDSPPPGHLFVWNPWKGMWYLVPKYDGWEDDFDPFYWRR